MSTVAKGASRVGSVLTQLSRLGYRCARVSASGQRKGKRKDEMGIAGDAIALAPTDSGLPHLLVEVGGEKKSVRSAMAELLKHPLPPGFAPLVARCMSNRRWRWHAFPEERGLDSLSEALEAMKTQIFRRNDG